MCPRLAACPCLPASGIGRWPPAAMEYQEEQAVSMDEIRALQQELEKAQSSGSLNRLAERNCVQIVMKLMELKMIDLLYTMDGKECVARRALSHAHAHTLQPSSCMRVLVTPLHLPTLQTYPMHVACTVLRSRPRISPTVEAANINYTPLTLTPS